MGHWMGRDITQELQVHAARATQLSSQLEATQAQTLQSGLLRNLWRHWHDIRQLAGGVASVISDRKGVFESLLRTWKLCLQSAILGLGAFLVVDGVLSPGAMIASTILMLRALGPVDVLALHWPLLVEARQSWRIIRDLFERHVQDRGFVGDTAPIVGGAATAFVTSTREKPDLDSIEIALDPGDVLGVIGASGAGKSAFLTTLFKADLVAARMSQMGSDLAQAKALCHSAVYLGANPRVFSGTIAQNISGFRSKARGSEIKKAAMIAGIDQQIEALENGYGTDVGNATLVWPADVRYRLSLSQAIFEAPPLLLLDDPFADQSPSTMQYITHLLETRTAAKQTTIFTARHPTALGVCQKLLWLEDGRCRAFGTRDAVLARFLAPRATQEPATGMDMAS
jgi:ATP-binding cassette subfamily C protein